MGNSTSNPCLDPSSTLSYANLLKTVASKYQTLSEQDIIDMILHLDNRELKLFMRQFLTVLHLPVPPRMEDDRVNLCRQVTQLLLESSGSVKAIVGGMSASTSLHTAMKLIADLARDPSEKKVFSLVQYLETHSFSNEDKNILLEAIDRLSMTTHVVDKYRNTLGVFLL